MATKLDTVKSKASPENSNNKPLFVWKSPDNIQHKRSSVWYLAVTGAALAIGFLLGWQEIWTGVAMVAIAFLLFVAMSRIKPRDVAMAIYSEGIVVDDKTYKFDEFKSFWINQSEVPKAKLQRIGRIAGQVELPLLNIDQDQIRLFLSKRLPEEPDRGEDLVDLVNRIMRF